MNITSSCPKNMNITSDMDTQKMYMLHDDITNDIIYERDCEIIEIARDMSELHSLTKSMNECIDQQGYQVDSILSNITISGENCKDAVNLIEKAKNEDKKSIKNTMIWISAGIVSGITVVGAIVGSIILL